MELDWRLRVRRWSFGADLFADVDAEAEDVGIAAGDVDELIAVGDDPDLAIDVGEVEEALDLAGLGDRR